MEVVDQNNTDTYIYHNKARNRGHIDTSLKKGPIAIPDGRI